MSPELDQIAIDLVALDGHRMKLTGEERLEAIRIMADHKVPSRLIAWRLGLKIASLQRIARNNNIALPLTVEPAHWSVEYIASRTRESRRRRTASK